MSKSIVANLRLSGKLTQGKFDAAQAASKPQLSKAQKLDLLFTNKIEVLSSKISKDSTTLETVDKKTDLVLLKEEAKNLLNNAQRFFKLDPKQSKLKSGESGIITVKGEQFIAQNLGKITLEELLMRLQPKSVDPSKKYIRFGRYAIRIGQ